jgi:acetolactate decarboxylase
MPVLDPHLLHGIHLTRLRRADALGDGARSDTVFQTSSIAALLDGAYEGDLTFRELARHGDFGIGTLQQLDGEMIAIDGAFYVARADGRVSMVPPDTSTPFAVVVPWTTDGRRPLTAAVSLAALSAEIDRAVPPDGEVLAVRVDGHFLRVRARSVPKQWPPYATLAEVAARQVVFEWHDLDATLVGFRCPASAEGYDLVGYHWHVLSTDRTHGGHLLDCAMTSGTLAFHRAVALHVEIPRGLAWHPPESSAARDGVLKRIESA